MRTFKSINHGHNALRFASVLADFWCEFNLPGSVPCWLIRVPLYASKRAVSVGYTDAACL